MQAISASPALLTAVEDQILRQYQPDLQGPALDYVASLLRQQFDQGGSLDSLEGAIKMHHKAVELTPSKHLQRAGVLCNLGIALQRRFVALRQRGDISAAIDALEEALRCVPEDSPDRAQYLTNYGVALQRRSEWSSLPADYDTAIAVLDDAVRLTPPDSPRLPMRLNNLAVALLGRSLLTHSLDHLNRGLDAINRAYGMLTEEDPFFYMILNTLSDALQLRSKRNNSLKDLDDAIQMKKRALEMISPTRADYQAIHHGLFTLLVQRAERTGSDSDLRQALQINDALLNSTDPDSITRFKVLTDSGKLFILRSEYSKDPAGEVRTAVSRFKQAIDLASKLEINDVHRGKCLASYAFSLLKRFEQEGNLEDLDESLATSTEAMLLIPPDNPDRTEVVNNLSTAWRRRYERTGNIDDLNNAITNTKTIVTQTSKENVFYASYVGNYASYLHDRFERTGSLDDLDLSIENYEDAIKYLAEENRVDCGRILTNFAGVLQRRSERTGSLADLDLAIEKDRLAATKFPPDHIDLLATLNNLSFALRRRFERTMESDVASETSAARNDLDECVTIARRVVHLAQPDHPDFPLYLTNLAVALNKQFQETRAPATLAEAIEQVEVAIAKTPPDHYSLANRHCSLAEILLSKYNMTKDSKILDRAIDESEKAGNSAHSDDVSRAAYLSVLALSLDERIKIAETPGDVERAIRARKDALAVEGSAPIIRLLAAEAASRLLISRDPVRAKHFLEQAVDLLPLLSPRTLHRSDQQYNISKFFGVTSAAASLSLQCGDGPLRALQILETGRGILASLQLEVRSDIADLSKAYPELAKKFIDLREQIADPVSSSTSLDAKQARAYRSLVNEFDTVLREIRTLPGFKEFLRGPSEEQAIDFAKNDDAIVVFNISEIRSDVIIINKGVIRSMPLSKINHSNLRDHTLRFLKAIDFLHETDYIEARREVNAILKWLWDVAIGPILKALRFTKHPAPGQLWPRVWWVGNGLLNILPLHAAGYHDSSTKNALDRVISSYAPNIKALFYARETSFRAKSDEQKVLIVGMPHTPEYADLPYVETELRELQDLDPISTTSTVPSTPMRDDVLSKIPHHQFVHFACHGRSESDPSKSTLVLHDWKVLPLTVADLIALNLKDGQFAYLSACQTAVTENLRLLDESINLVSAVQLAGFPSVIGTLWQVIDSHSAEVTRDVYTGMLGTGMKLDHSRSAEALHHAIRRLRDRTRLSEGLASLGPNDPIVWGPYIHVGI